MTQTDLRAIRLLLDKAEDAGLVLLHEKDAYNYLLEIAYEHLPFERTQEGARLFSMCVDVLIHAIVRAKE